MGYFFYDEISTLYPLCVSFAFILNGVNGESPILQLGVNTDSAYYFPSSWKGVWWTCRSQDQEHCQALLRGKRCI